MGHFYPPGSGSVSGLDPDTDPKFLLEPGILHGGLRKHSDSNAYGPFRDSTPRSVLPPGQILYPTIGIGTGTVLPLCCFQAQEAKTKASAPTKIRVPDEIQVIELRVYLFDANPVAVQLF